MKVKKIITALACALIVTASASANAYEDPRYVTFGENLVMNSLEGTLQYCPKFDFTDGYMTGFSLSVFFLHFQFYDSFDYSCSYSGGPYLCYFFNNHIAVHGSADFGYYYKKVKSTETSWGYENKHGFYYDFKIGPTFSFGNENLSFDITADVGFNRADHFYLGCGIGVRCNPYKLLYALSDN